MNTELKIHQKHLYYTHTVHKIPSVYLHNIKLTILANTDFSIPFQADGVLLGVAVSGIPQSHSVAKSGTTGQL